MRERLQKHLAKKQDQLNARFRDLFDAVQLSKAECDELLGIINDKLPGHMNNIAHHLRGVLCAAIDVIATEDGLANLDKPKGK